MDVIETARLCNIIAGTGLFSYCMMRTTRDWPHWTRRERAVRVHLAGYLFVLTTGTALILWGVADGLRALMLLVVHTSFAAALWRNRHDPVRDAPTT